jgi:hypothetical protein
LILPFFYIDLNGKQMNFMLANNAISTTHTLGLRPVGRRFNSRFAKAGVSCFYDSEVLNSSFVHLMNFSAEKPRLRKAAKR